MKRVLALLGLSLLALGNVQASEDLAKAKLCTGCHSVDKKILGPAYKDVAQKYAGVKGADADLAKKIKAGGSGVWGQVPMPPNNTVSEAEALTLAQWVLSLK
ncbi:MAG TPA: c-type cytochrome [Azospira sp.]|nr:c-type cytochrome [Azospira sp.]